MKSLLISLTLGLYAQDVKDEQLPLINRWLQSGYISLSENIYKFKSSYRAGTISIASHSNAYLQVTGVSVKDLFIASDDLNEAINGDLVIAKRVINSRIKASAKVVEVVGREVSYGVAYIKIVNGSNMLFDIKHDEPIAIEVTPFELNSYEDGDVFQIDNFSNKISKKLGNISDEKVDELIVLAMFNKHDEFEDDVKAVVTQYDKSVDASLYPHRKDLRELNFCTIDPVTAKDFDDAIFYDNKKNILYVAIADVSEYVKPYGAIDAEAIYRGFSIYLPHRSIPMLPRELSENLCSLKPHVDRLSYVFEMHLDDAYDVKSSEHYEAIIHSSRRFNYDEVDAIFDGKLKAKDETEELIFSELIELRKLTTILKVKRMKSGFDFRSEDLDMFLDENQHLISTEYAKETPSHALVEDCMLLANKEAASNYERGVFRVHEAPSQAKLQNLYQNLATIGIFVEAEDSFRQNMTKIDKISTEMNIEKDVDALLIKAQMRARYDVENSGHFGLGFKCYTHFTSPIRRYSDLIVHRLLKSINAKDKSEADYILRNIELLTIELSQKEREASEIEFRFQDRKFARYAALHVGEEFEAKIVTIEPYVSAELLMDLVGVHVELPSSDQILLFDKVVVKIVAVNLATAKIEAALVSVQNEEINEI